MRYDALQTGKLIRRYKRFLADVELASGEIVVAHCANTGAMTGLKEAGSRVWLSHHDNSARKLAWSWEFIEVETARGAAYASVNTSKANALVKEGIVSGAIPPLAHPLHIQPEYKVGEGRLDFRLDFEDGPCLVEVKQVTLLEETLESEGAGLFPDAVSQRGLKHLELLMQQASEGIRAVLLFCVPHTGITSVAPAEKIDPAYAGALRQAVREGVEVLAYGCDIQLGADEAEIRLARPLPVLL